MHDALSLAFRAAPTILVEREKRGGIAVHARIGLVGEQLADAVIHLQVGDGIGTRTLADGALIYVFHPADTVQVTGKLAEHAGHIAGFFQLAPEGRIEDIPHQGRFPAAAHAAYHRQHPQGELNVDILEVVLHGTFYLDGIVPPATLADETRPCTRKILQGKGFLQLRHPVLQVSAEDHTAPFGTRFRSHIDQQVGRPHHLLVVFHHHHGVADIAQPPEHLDQAGGVPRMQADAGFVQDIERSHQGTSQGRHQTYPLAFPAGKRVARPAEGQVRQAHIADILQSGNHLFDGLPRNGPLGIGQRHRGEKCQQFIHVHIQQFSQVPSAHLDIQGLRAQTCPVTGMAGGPAGEPAQHIFVLDFVSVRLHPLEKLGNPDQGVIIPGHAVGVPDGIALLLRKVAVRFERADAIFRCQPDHVVAEPAHLLSPPAGDGAVVQAFRFIGHHQIFAHADDLSQATAHRAGSQGAVEAEEVFIGLFEGHPVHFHAVHESISVRLPFPLDIDFPVSAGIGIGHGG